MELDAHALTAPRSMAQELVTRAADARLRVHEQEVRRLLDAGLRLMTERGATRAPRVSDIVQAAGLSNQAFYRYFLSKDELVAAVIDEGERRLVAYVEHQMAKEQAPEAQLRQCVRAVADQAGAADVAQATRAVLAQATGADAGGARSRQLVDLLAALLVEPVRALGSSDAARDARTSTAAITSLMLDHLWRGTPPSAEDVEHVVQFCLSGIRRSAP